MNQGDNRPKKRRRHDHKCTSKFSESVEKTSGTVTILPWTKSQYVPVLAEEMVDAVRAVYEHGSRLRGIRYF